MINVCRGYIVVCLLFVITSIHRSVILGGDEVFGASHGSQAATSKTFFSGNNLMHCLALWDCNLDRYLAIDFSKSSHDVVALLGQRNNDGYTPMDIALDQNLTQYFRLNKLLDEKLIAKYSSGHRPSGAKSERLKRLGL